MTYTCRLCEKKFMDGHWLKVILPDNTETVMEICEDCRDKHPDDELYKLVIRRILN